MPAKKKLTETAAETPAPAPRRRATPRPKLTEPAVEAPAPAPAKPAPKAPAKPRKAAAPKTPAATHKAPARKVAPRKSSPAAPAFDLDRHRAEIEREAYFLWLNRGGVHGSDAQDWLDAVALVKARYA